VAHCCYFVSNLLIFPVYFFKKFGDQLIRFTFLVLVFRHWNCFGNIFCAAHVFFCGFVACLCWLHYIPWVTLILLIRLITVCPSLMRLILAYWTVGPFSVKVKLSVPSLCACALPGMAVPEMTYTVPGSGMLHLSHSHSICPSSLQLLDKISLNLIRLFNLRYLFYLNISRELFHWSQPPVLQ